MNLPTVGVVGCGFVGSAVLKGFNLFTEVKAFDVDSTKCCNPLEEVLFSDFVFVCLPTPMLRADGGRCDLSIIERFFDSLEDKKIGPDTVFILKSTVPIGTTKKLSEKHPNLKIVHSPEFLTARTALLDFITPARNIVGGEDAKSVKKVCNLYTYRFPGVPVVAVSSEESETIKYFINCFLMTKVLFFNEMRLLTDKLGLSWDAVLDGVMSDQRISKTHFQVPGWDGQRGAGGACFCKDINALIDSFQKNGLDPKILKAVWSQNLAVREKWDWSEIPSAVSNR